MSRIPFSKLKSKQLSDLLTTKFVNKFKIDKVKEKNLLEIIDEEVDNLLTSGQAYEKNLLKLENKLYTTVALERNRVKTEKSEAFSSKKPTASDVLSVGAISKATGSQAAKSETPI